VRLAVAKLGGYLARKNDTPPEKTVLWRGLSRLTDIHQGVELGRGFGSHLPDVRKRKGMAKLFAEVVGN